jgi:5-methylcytosine-specific restriction endonuclease McrA
MSLNKKAIRTKFREVVFQRDGYKCLFCSETKNLDAHHIINRNLMPDGGYFLANGATLCETHHLKAENGEISPIEIFEKIDKGSLHHSHSATS